MTEARQEPARSMAGAAGQARDNVPIYSVGEISQAVKHTVEGAFPRVRVRGEISRPSFPSSGHCYFRLKDESAVLDSVVWRSVLGRLRLRPEDGLEVIATGRLTTFAGKSSYQIVVESLELAGEGALLKLLEERRKKLASEGLFAEERKRLLPYLPEVVGVVTSPTGSVIRDILHRLAERFPRRVLVWPVAVQGEQAAPQVAAAIRGFNALPARGPEHGPEHGAPARPDVLIVARGGGSLEDLWAFNEEEVVRAAAASGIPLISAVGHETDTTLIDYAADRRAPTPSAAAEIAVPVRSELTNLVLDFARRLAGAGARGVEARRTHVEGLARGLPDPWRLLQEKAQRLDERGERLHLAATRLLRQEAEKVTALGWRLPHPRQQLHLAAERLQGAAERLGRTGTRNVEMRRERYLRIDAGRRLDNGIAAARRDAARQVDELARLLDSFSYRKTLKRGFAVVRAGASDGAALTQARDVQSGQPLDIEFADGHVGAVADAAGGAAGADGRPSRGTGERRGKARRGRGGDDSQGSLL